jgi:putative SOS response-associated peptidase YedK
MCGRFVAASSPTLVAEHFGVDDVNVDDDEPNYNVAPRAQVMVVRERPTDAGPRRVLSRVRWGLVPSWAKSPTVGDRMINARAEGLLGSSAYRPALERRRCLIPADGFYEWKVVAPPSTPKGRPQKQPVFVRRRDGVPLAFAGLWSVWKVPDDAGAIDGVDDGWLRSCAIVTTTPNELLAPVHDRMPVVLPESAWGRWLDPERHDVGALSGLLGPAPEEWFEMWPVSTRVNSADNTGPDLVQPIAGATPVTTS